MNQYQRMVSYLYHYHRGNKGENAGYVRMEQRGERCRMTLRLQGRISGPMPSVYFFRQTPEGRLCQQAGKLQNISGGFGCRTETETQNILGSQEVTDFDGVIVWVSQEDYYATTWKDMIVSPGKMIIVGEGKKEDAVPSLAAAERAEDGSQEVLKRERAEEDAEVSENGGDALKIEVPGDGRAVDGAQVTESRKAATGAQAPESKAAVAGADIPESRKSPAERSSVGENIPESAEGAEAQGGDSRQGREASAGRQEGAAQEETEGKGQQEIPLQAQSVCAACPLRGEDYGQRILSLYPDMYPFTEPVFERCVRIEPKDLGNLPVRAWSLAGNRFLLHGYYCYRHLIFIRRRDGYCIGVPGVYSDKNLQQAQKFGFREFEPLSRQGDITGAFGYWIYPLAREKFTG